MIKTLTLEEVAEIARCHKETVRRAMKRGEIKAAGRRQGKRGSILFLEEDALQWALGGADTAPGSFAENNIADNTES